MAGGKTELVGLKMVGEIGQQGRERHERPMKIKRPSLAAALPLSKKERSARLRPRKASATSSTISLICQQLRGLAP